MSESKRIFDALKRLLKSRGMSYGQLAPLIGVSEAGVKRMFSKEAMTVERLMEVCQKLEVSFYDLAKLTIEDDAVLSEELTEEQEHLLMSDKKLAALFYLLLNRWTPAEILKEYRFSAIEMEKSLISLDKNALIELHPGNRVKLLCSRSIIWNKRGELAAEYRKNAMMEFLNQEIEAEQSDSRFRAGELSPTSIRVLNIAVEKLEKDFERMAKADASLEKERTRATGIYLSMRPMTYTLFEELKRKRKT